jgi:hypothetical protein
MGRRVWVAAATAIVALGSLVVATPAGAVTASFDATCVTQSGSFPVFTEHRTIAYEVHAPDSVAPGTTFDVPVSFEYPIPSNAQVGGAFIDVTGTSTVLIDGTPGASTVTGTVTPTALGGAGSAVEVRLQKLAAFAVIDSHGVGEICTPTHTLVLARIGVGVPVVSIGDGAIVEGASGVRSLVFPVTLSRAAATQVTVGFDTGDGTATAGSDYDATSGTVTIRSGAIKGFASVPVRGDTVVEPKENFHVRLRDPSGAVLGRRVGTGRIIDDDPESGTRLSIGDAAVVEGRLGDHAAAFTVSLSAPLSHTVTFHYATLAGTAGAQIDYRSQSFDSEIAAGQTSISIPVPVLADAVPEDTESFVVRLSGVTGATLGRTNGVGKILDDD